MNRINVAPTVPPQRAPAKAVRVVEIAKESHSAPACVFVKLQLRKVGLRKLQTGMHICFGEQTSSLCGGAVRFALKRAELRLTLVDCSMPVGMRANVALLTVATKVTSEIGLERGRSCAKSSTDHLELIKPSISVQQKADYLSNEKHVEKISFSTDRFAIATSGSEECPVWTFKSSPGNEFLEGMVPIKDWGTVIVSEDPAKITVTLNSEPEDVIVTGVDGVWAHQSLLKLKLLKVAALKQVGYNRTLCHIEVATFVKGGTAHANT